MLVRHVTIQIPVWFLNGVGKWLTQLSGFWDNDQTPHQNSSKQSSIFVVWLSSGTFFDQCFKNRTIVDQSVFTYLKTGLSWYLDRHSVWFFKNKLHNFLLNIRTFSKAAIIMWTCPSLLEPSQDARVAKSMATRCLQQHLIFINKKCRYSSPASNYLVNNLGVWCVFIKGYIFCIWPAKPCLGMRLHVWKRWKTLNYQKAPFSFSVREAHGSLM